jgi:hypothetical protein
MKSSSGQSRLQETLTDQSKILRGVKRKSTTSNSSWLKETSLREEESLITKEPINLQQGSETSTHLTRTKEDKRLNSLGGTHQSEKGNRLLDNILSAKKLA